MADERVVPVDISVTESKVTFTTKELLARIDLRFEHLEVLAENSATRGQVDAILVRVDKLEREAEGTKAVATALLSADTNRWSKNEKVVGLFLATVVAIPTITDIIKLFS